MPVLDELELQRAFNSFCKKLLRNEAINAIVALQRRKNTVLNFSDINFDEEVMVGSYDRTIDPDTEYLVVSSIFRTFRNHLVVVPPDVACSSTFSVPRVSLACTSIWHTLTSRQTVHLGTRRPSWFCA